MAAEDQEFEEFGDVASVLADGPSGIVDEMPSAELWSRISSELSPDVAPVVPDPDVIPLSVRRSRRSRRIAVAIGAVAAMLLIGVPLFLAFGTAEDEPADLVAQLDTLNDFEGAAVAELRGRELSVDVDGLGTQANAHYELWLLDFDGGELVDLRSLGDIDADGTWQVPADIDVAEFNVVDISVEPNDGNPDHSGDSVLRGDLT